MSNEPYRDEETLREMYWDDGMCHREMGEELDCSRQLISHYFRQYDIPTREHSCAIRMGKESDEPWRDEDTLRELYWDEGLSQSQVADELGVSRQTIKTWMKRHDIERRTVREAQREMGWTGVSFFTRREGYECLSVRDGEETYVFAYHRLLAMVDNDVGELEGNHIHHKNHIPWDNRMENIEVMTPEEHSKLHKSVD